MSKSRRWLIVTICPSSLKAKPTISLAGTFRMFASSETVMNSVTRTSVFSRSFSSPLLLLDLAEARPFLAAVRALLRHRPFDRRQGARDVLGDRFLIHQRLLALLALLPLLAPPLLQRNRARRRRGDWSGRRGHGAAGSGTRHRLGPQGGRDHGTRRGGRGRGEGRGGVRRRESGRRRLRSGLLGHRELLEHRRGALLERRLLLLVHGFGRLERLARLQLALRLDRRFGL